MSGYFSASVSRARHCCVLEKGAVVDNFPVCMIVTIPENLSRTRQRPDPWDRDGGPCWHPSFPLSLEAVSTHTLVQPTHWLFQLNVEDSVVYLTDTLPPFVPIQVHSFPWPSVSPKDPALYLWELRSQPVSRTSQQDKAGTR